MKENIYRGFTLCAAVAAFFLGAGCDGDNSPQSSRQSSRQVERVPSIQPRFIVKYGDYIRTPGALYDVELVILQDQRGTNDLLVITTSKGTAIQFIPRIE